jgi:hypothetical protein
VKDKKDWRDVIDKVNLYKVVSVLTIVTAVPLLYYFWVKDENSLLMSVGITIMVLWGAVIAFLVGLTLVVMLFVLLDYIFYVIKPILRWFLY